MSNQIVENLKIVKDKVLVSSLYVAEVFKKNHSHILRDVKNLCDDEFKEANFRNGTYKDQKGELRPCYNLTRDGFSLLVMGFTGERAYKFKIEFIKAFNEMEKRLKNLEAEKMQKLAFHQKIGYKSQLIQQKEKYENKIKAMQYDLEKKNELGFKRKLSAKELLELRKILAKDYDTVCFPKWEYFLFAEDISVKNYKLEKENDFFIYKDIKKNFDRKLDYWKNYDECEAKWKKLLGRS